MLSQPLIEMISRPFQDIWPETMRNWLIELIHLRHVKGDFVYFIKLSFGIQNWLRLG
jgi:hypothetical protein